MREETHYYFLVLGGKAKESIQAYLDGLQNYSDHLRALCDKYGAMGWLQAGPFLMGLQFKEAPSVPWKHLPRKHSHYRDDIFTADSRTKIGKALKEELHSVAYPDFRVSGKGDSWVINDRHLYKPTFEKIGEKFILLIPINSNPEKQFVPDGELQQLKTSEYWVIKEEYKPEQEQEEEG